MTQYKRPVSVLVVIHTAALNVLLLERTSHSRYWQSVTGSQEDGESLLQTAVREVEEETGIHAPAAQFKDWHHSNCFEIFPEWRHRYEPGTTHNIEHVFSLIVPEAQAVRISPDEHLNYQWLPWQEAAEQCFSWSNREAILNLPFRMA